LDDFLGIASVQGRLTLIAKEDEEMMRSHYRSLAAGALLLLSMLGLSGMALATPDINSAVINERIFDDCPTSTLSTINTYPALIAISDNWDCSAGFANRHNWRFSTDGATNALFENDDSFRFEADLMISGSGNGEGGIGISPWWSQNVDGIFNVRTTDGEIACFGGRLPFFNFTGSFGVVYVKGTPIHLEIEYQANSNSMADPGTIEYTVTYNAITYSSGVLNFDEGNPAEDPPYGLWGILNDATAGGFIQCFIGGAPNSLTAEWTNIVFENLKLPNATEDTSWGKLKGLYR
jgi:hypothetical protein